MTREFDISDEAAWRAVLTRDPLMDGRFVYAVRTTGVFCRPICPSRKPKRQNVLFFSSSGDAAAAGFRACRRCSPQGTPTHSGAELVERMYRYLDEHLDEPVTLEQLGRDVGLSPWHAQRTFKKLTGLSPREYVAMKRTDRMKSHLRRGGTVSRAIYEAGFNSSSVVYESAAQNLGMTPAAYRDGGRGVEMMYTIADCRLGKVLVAATERGVSSVAFGEDDAQLLQGLREEFPNADLEQAFGGFDDWIREVTSFLEGEIDQLDLPLDVGGTQFQQRVWKELRQIPYGTTRSYAEVARRIGKPDAVRAVANACANNRAAVAIPCHRVVRTDGNLGGYKWGLERKKQLLRMERERSSSP